MDDTQDDDSDGVVLVPVSKDSLLQKNLVDFLLTRKRYI